MTNTNSRKIDISYISKFCGYKQLLEIYIGMYTQGQAEDNLFDVKKKKWTTLIGNYIRRDRSQGLIDRCL